MEGQNKNATKILLNMFGSCSY